MQEQRFDASFLALLAELCEPAIRHEMELIEWIDLRFEYKGAKMGSLDRTSRMNQKSEAEKNVEARLAKLKELGLDDKKIARDPLLRKAKAALKKSITRLRAIDARDALTQELAARKAKPKVEPKGKAGAKKAQPKAAPKGKAGAKKAKPKAAPKGKADAKKAQPKAAPKGKADAKKAQPKAAPKGKADAKDAKGEKKPKTKEKEVKAQEA